MSVRVRGWIKQEEVGKQRASKRMIRRPRDEHERSGRETELGQTTNVLEIDWERVGAVEPRLSRV